MTAGFGVLGFNQTGTLAGPLTVNMDTDTFFVGSSYLTIEGENTVTLGSGVTVRGQGQIGSQFSFGGTNALINQGLISADTSDQPGARTLSIFESSFTNEGTARAINGGALAINATSWSNAASGTIRATDSTLDFGGAWSNAGAITITDSTFNAGGTFSTASLGTINRTGGVINITGEMDNAGAAFLSSSIGPGATRRRADLWGLDQYDRGSPTGVFRQRQ
jgi:hypothetical protein